MCFGWHLQSFLPVSNVTLVPYPTSPSQYKSFLNIHPMTRYITGSRTDYFIIIYVLLDYTGAFENGSIESMERGTVE